MSLELFSFYINFFDGSDLFKMIKFPVIVEGIKLAKIYFFLKYIFDFVATFLKHQTESLK
jgi:hypothetical protein